MPEQIVQIIIPPEDIAKLLAKLEAIVREKVIMDSLYQGGQYIAGWIKNYRLSGRISTYIGLNIKSNRLRSSITASKAERIGDSYIVSIGTNVEYAPIHEFGGIINHPARQSVLLFRRYKRGKFAGRTLFAKEKQAQFGQKVSIGAYQIRIPARPFLRPGIEDESNKAWILNNLKENIEQAMENAG